MYLIDKNTVISVQLMKETQPLNFNVMSCKQNQRDDAGQDTGTLPKL